MSYKKILNLFKWPLSTIFLAERLIREETLTKRHIIQQSISFKRFIRKQSQECLLSPNVLPQVSLGFDYSVRCEQFFCDVIRQSNPTS